MVVVSHVICIQQGEVTLVCWKQSLLMSKRNCGTRKMEPYSISIKLCFRATSLHVAVLG